MLFSTVRRRKGIVKSMRNARPIVDRRSSSRRLCHRFGSATP